MLFRSRDWSGSHRRDVGEVLGRGARPDLLRARPAGGEVVVLDQQVRAHAVAGVRGHQDSTIVAGTDQLAPGARQQRGEGGQKLLRILKISINDLIVFHLLILIADNSVVKYAVFTMKMKIILKN